MRQGLLQLVVELLQPTRSNWKSVPPILRTDGQPAGGRGDVAGKLGVGPVVGDSRGLRSRADKLIRDHTRVGFEGDVEVGDP